MRYNRPSFPIRSEGLYDPQYEHDSCGIGAVVNISGRREYQIIEYAKQVLLRLQHRGASGADETTGDGAGILFQIPQGFFADEAERLKISLPPAGEYGVGMLFLPRRREARSQCEAIFCETILEGGLEVLAWRDVPTCNSRLGQIARSVANWRSASSIRPSSCSRAIRRTIVPSGTTLAPSATRTRRAEDITRQGSRTSSHQPA